ncbi:MAG TPA: pitrilysin family protein [Bryobacteraceae bacterium]|nr:pitrilysin family protein [Bryobacteraceae bacterium]
MTIRNLIPLVFAAALLAQTPSYKDLKYPPLPQVKIPDVATSTLPNGIKLYLLENHELPLVGGFALVRTGNLFDPVEKVGLAGITGAVLRTGGTKAKTGDQIDEQLENIAASVESSIGETSGRVGFSCLRENTDQVLAVFKEILTAPEFRQEKIDLIKGQMKGGIARRNDDASGIAQREISDIVYGRDNPYGWSQEYEHLDRIQREDVLNFYKRYYFPSNIIIAIQGDFSAPEMKAKVEKIFADWAVKQPPVPAFPPVKAKAAPGVYLATKSDVTQTFFHMGHLAGMLNDKNYPALEVMSDILGGSFSSRLFREVRTRLGLAYSIHSNWGATFDHPGIFQISGSTKSASTVDAIQAARAELDKIRTVEVTDQEVDSAKQTVLNSFVFNFDSPGKTLSRIVTYEYYGYPRDFIFQYQKAVEAVTKADILRVAKQYLKPEDLTIVAVGKAAEFGKALSTLGPVKTIDLTIPEPKKTVAAKTDSNSLTLGKQLLQRAQQAVGGAARLAAVKDLTQSIDMQLAAGPKAKQLIQWIAPGTFRSTQELPFGKIIAFYDGNGTGWLVTPQGSAPMPGPVVKQVQDQLFRNMLTLLLSDRDPNRSVSATDAGAVDISDKEGHSLRMEFDKATGLPAKLSYESPGAQGAPVHVEENYAEWKESGGLKYASKVVVQQGGQKSADASVIEYKANSGLTAELLGKKP